MRDGFKLHTAGGNFFAPVDVTPIEDNDYRDPVGDPRERWLAAFAPVGRIGYLLVVAIPHERALEPSRPLFTLLTMYGGQLNLGFLVICAIAVWASLRGTRPLPMRDED